MSADRRTDNPNTAQGSGPDANESPPFFGSWKGVYLFVAGFFVVEVVVLILFSRFFS